MIDFAILAAQWQLEKLSCDINGGGDGTVDFLDWPGFAHGWGTVTNAADLANFAQQWLADGACQADIAPLPAGDGRVDILDFALFAEYWLQGGN